MQLVARRRVLTIGLGGAAAIALPGVPSPALAYAAPQARIGEPAPTFSLTDSNGKAVSLTDFKGKTVVLEWTNHECPYVRKHYGANNMQMLQKKWTAQGVVWLTLIKGVFEGETINTPSMLCVEDYLDALDWAERIGGLEALYARTNANARVLFDWVERTSWLENLAVDPATRSNTSVCLRIADPAIVRLPLDAQRAFVKKLETLLEKEKAALDIAGHRDAPPCLRIWCGSTVEAADLAALTPWLDWAFAECKAALAEAV
jgi:cytochrome oxidase Cu insertion factor (SCO1/SenC/PrrC family)